MHLGLKILTNFVTHACNEFHKKCIYNQLGNYKYIFKGFPKPFRSFCSIYGICHLDW